MIYITHMLDAFKVNVANFQFLQDTVEVCWVRVTEIPAIHVCLMMDASPNNCVGPPSGK